MNHSMSTNNNRRNERRFSVIYDGQNTNILMRYFFNRKHVEQSNMLMKENASLCHTKDKLVDQINMLISRAETLQNTNESQYKELEIQNNTIQDMQNHMQVIQNKYSAAQLVITTLEQQCQQHDLSMAKYEQQVLVLEHQLDTAVGINEKSQDNVYEYQDKYTSCM